jgi:hypothetical protein
MTINYARESVIDFTKPFMNLGISILFKAPKDPATEVRKNGLVTFARSDICSNDISAKCPDNQTIWLIELKGTKLGDGERH